MVNLEMYTVSDHDETSSYNNVPDLRHMHSFGSSFAVSRANDDDSALKPELPNPEEASHTTIRPQDIIVAHP